MYDEKTQWTLDVIEKLFSAKIGDESRLQAIKDAIINGRTVYDSDKKYIKEKFEQLKTSPKLDTLSESDPTPQADEGQTLRDMIVVEKLQKSEIGNPERLAKIKEMLEKQQHITIDDDQYLKVKYEHLKKVDNVEQKIENTLNIIKKLQKEEIGNSERLESIKKTINQRRSLSNEDDVYLNEKFKQYKKINNQNFTSSGNENTTQPKRTYNPEFKSEGTTLVLSIILGLFGLCGVGHMYVGQVGKGVGILIGGLVLLIVGMATILFGVGIVFIIIFIALFIWQIVDSRKQCFYYNEYLENNGKRPW